MSTDFLNYDMGNNLLLRVSPQLHCHSSQENIEGTQLSRQVGFSKKKYLRANKKKA
jgi:hypothetical protein